MSDSQDRILKLEEKIEKLGDTVSSVDIRLEKMITKVDIILDQHGIIINKHDGDIENLKKEMHERTWFKSKTSKVIAFFSALLLFVLSNVFLGFIENKIEQKQDVTRVISTVSDSPSSNQNIYK